MIRRFWAPADRPAYPESVRLFVGFAPPEEPLADAAEAVERLWGEAPGLRWIPPHRWHVTLAFLGEVDPARIPDVVDALAEACTGHGALEDLRLIGAGAFSSTLWLGIEPTERHSPADRLARSVQRALRSVRVPVERKPWRAHLTIARMRHQAPPGAVINALGAYVGPAFAVDRVTLVHSVTGPKPRYEALAEVELADIP